MPTTPIHGLPYPALVNPADIPTDMGELALAVDGAIPTTAGGLPADTVVAAAVRIIANKLLAGDTQPAWRVLGDGKLEWGPGGATAPDTNLYRFAAGQVKTDGELQSTSWLRGGAGTTGLITLGNNAGQPQIYFGNAFDTTLYRPAANTLRTESDFIVARNYGDATRSGLWLNVNGVLTQVLVGATDSGGTGYKMLRIAN